MSGQMVSCCSCDYCEYVKAHTDIFKNKVLIKRVHNAIQNNPNADTNFEELYCKYYNIRNMKDKQYRESKNTDKESMEKLRNNKWYGIMKIKVK